VAWRTSFGAHQNGGTATVFDRQGRIGTSSIANVERAVDFEMHDFSNNPRVSGA